MTKPRSKNFYTGYRPSRLNAAGSAQRSALSRSRTMDILIAGIVNAHIELRSLYRENRATAVIHAKRNKLCGLIRTKR